MGKAEVGGAGIGERLMKNMDFQTATSEIQRISAASQGQKSEEGANTFLTLENRVN